MALLSPTTPPPAPAPVLPPAEAPVLALALASAPETPAPETPALNALVSASASESTNTTDIVMYAESSLGKRSASRELPWAYTALRKRNPRASEHYMNHLTILENGGIAPGAEASSTEMSETWVNYLEGTRFEESDYTEAEKTRIIGELEVLFCNVDGMKGDNDDDNDSTDSSPKKKAKS